jgi:integral membrane sensor domain MASE1
LLLLFYFIWPAKLTLSLSLPPSYAAAIWPPAGIGLAAVLLWGNRALPGIFLADLLINYQVYDLVGFIGISSAIADFFSYSH